jgi:hypothetical protein
LLLLSALLVSMGCSMTRFAVSTPGEVMERAAPVLEEQTDYELARAAAPGASFRSRVCCASSRTKSACSYWA